MLKIFVTSVILCVVVSEKQSYEKHSLFKITPSNENHVKLLRDLYETSSDLDFWRLPHKENEFVSVLSPAEKENELIEFLNKYGLNWNVELQNVQEAIDQQIPKRSKRDTSQRLLWTNYQLLEDIHEWFYELEREFPNVVSVIRYGQSYEGRNLTGIKISRGATNRAILLEGGMQGADWLTPPTLTYIANSLIHNTVNEIDLSEEYDWYIIPVTNPDGYMYSQDYIRFWTKNRRPFRNLVGTDLTRNWNSDWGHTGSFEAASGQFVGLGPFSEPETRHLSNFVSSLRQNLLGYISFRSFGQRILLPFANSTQHLGNYQQMENVARSAIEALSSRYGTEYTVGTSAEVHDGATGNAADWVKLRYDVPMVATYQLRDTGFYGYALPVTQVLPNCEEIFDSILAMVRQARITNVI